MPSCPNGYALFEAIDAHISAIDVPFDTLLGPGVDYDALRPEAITAVEARVILRDRETNAAYNNAIWAELIRRSRLHRDPWELVAVWAMTPGLRAAAWRLARRGAVELADAQSEVVVGFLQALRTVDLTDADLPRTLWRAANSHAWRVCRKPRQDVPTADIGAVKHEDSDSARLDGDQAVIHRGVVSSAGRTADMQTEGERLGALAERTGLRARPRTRCRAERMEGIIRYIRLGEYGARAGFPRTCHARQPSASGVRRHELRTED